MPDVVPHPLPDGRYWIRGDCAGCGRKVQSVRPTSSAASPVCRKCRRKRRARICAWKPCGKRYEYQRGHRGQACCSHRCAALERHRKLRQAELDRNWRAEVPAVVAEVLASKCYSFAGIDPRARDAVLRELFGRKYVSG